MGHVNQVIIYGVVCKRPKLRYLSESGRAHCQFQLAVNRPVARAKPPSQMTPEEADRITDYPWVYCRDELAEQVAQCVDVGSEVIVTGRMETRNYPERRKVKYNFCPQCGTELKEKTNNCPKCKAALPPEVKMRSVTEIRAISTEFVGNVNYPKQRKEVNEDNGDKQAEALVGEQASPAKPKEPAKARKASAKKATQQ